MVVPIDLMEGYKYIFREKNWVTSVLFVTLCTLSTSMVPIVGHILILGYLSEIFDSLQMRQPGYPAFDFNRFSQYLSRGAWLFLAAFVTELILLAIAIPIFLGAGLLIMGIGTSIKDGQDAIITLGFVILGILGIAAFAGMNIVMAPVMIRAMIRQDFGELFQVGFIREFIDRTWRESLITGLFLMISALVLMAGGALVFCMGMYFTMSLVNFAWVHLTHQLYNVYVARGGLPVARKVTP